MSNKAKLVLKELARYKLGTLGDFIVRNALLYPNKEAFIFGDKVVSFKEYNDRVNSVIHALHDRGVKKQNVIGVLSWNCLEYQDVYGAAEKGGFIIAPYNPRLSAHELEYLINDSTANTLFVGPELFDIVNNLKPRISKVKNFISFERATAGMEYHIDLLRNYTPDEPDMDVNEDDLVYIFYTSGTTAVPRGAVYSHRQQFIDTSVYHVELAVETGDRSLMIMPMFHVGGATFCRAYFFRGCLNVIIKTFDAKATLQAIQDYKITALHIVPTHLAFMFEVPDYEKYDLSSVKQMFYAASPMPVELLRRGLKLWGPIFTQAFGQTESGPVIGIFHRNDHNVLTKPVEQQAKLGSLGQPAIGCHLRIVDEQGNDVAPGQVGEIIAQSKALMCGYWNKPELTAETIVDGWLHTGDMGRYDEEGFVYVVDRKKDMIISGGENIYPREVEEILYTHPSVLECTVIGIPDPKWVESVHAIVSFKKGMSATPEELIAFCKERIARYKAPKSVEIVEGLPKSSAGKILKRQLREKYWVGKERRV